MPFSVSAAATACSISPPDMLMNSATRAIPLAYCNLRGSERRPASQLGGQPVEGTLTAK